MRWKSFMEEALLWCVCVGGAFANYKVGDFHLLKKKNWIRPAFTAFGNIMWSYLERSWWLKNFYSCKKMTLSILVNSVKGTLKTKRKSTTFSRCLGRRNQRTWILLDWCGMNLIKTSELNNTQIRFTSVNSCRKSRQKHSSLVYLQSSLEKMPRIC